MLDHGGSVIQDQRNMSQLTIKRSHELDGEQLLARVKQVAAKLEKYNAKVEWEGDRLARVSGSGIDGELRLEETLIQIDLRFGFLVAPFKGKIAEVLERELDEMLGGEGGTP